MHVVGLQKGPSKLNLDVQSHVINNSVSDSEKSLTDTYLMLVNVTDTKKRRSNMSAQLFRSARKLHGDGNSHDDLVSYEFLDGMLVNAAVNVGSAATKVFRLSNKKMNFVDTRARSSLVISNSMTDTVRPYTSVSLSIKSLVVKHTWPKVLGIRLLPNL